MWLAAILSSDHGALSAGEPQALTAAPAEGENTATLASSLPNASAPNANLAAVVSDIDQTQRPVNTMLRYGEYCGPGPKLVRASCLQLAQLLAPQLDKRR